MLTVYHYPACSTCKKAIKWLTDHGVEHKLVHIVEHPPSKAKLKQLLKTTGLPINKLFNTSGQVYRQGNYKERLASMSQEQALEELTTQGKLIKRPLVIGESEQGAVHLVGFKEADYDAAF